MSNVILQSFDMSLAHHGDDLVVSDSQGAYTFRELNEQVHIAKDALSAFGIGPGMAVGLCMPRNAECLPLVFALWKLGATYVPLDYKLPSERLAYMAGVSGLRLVVCDQTTEQTTASFFSNYLVWAQRTGPLRTVGALNQGGEAPTPLKDIAYIIFTSGSTGRPKGVKVSHAALDFYIDYAAKAYFDHVKASIVSSLLSVDATVTSVFAPIVTRTPIEILPDDGTEIEHLAELIERDDKPLLFKVTPTHIDLLLELLPDNAVFSQKHAFIVGGEEFEAGLARKHRHMFPHALVVNEYGPTEATVGCVVNYLPTASMLGDKIPIGNAMPGVELVVLSGSDGTPIETGEGELYIGGPGLAEGYVGLDEETRSRFVSLKGHNGQGARYYKTGDRVRWNTKRELEFLGRVDFQVKLHGFRIELEDIESALNRHPAVRHSVVRLAVDNNGTKSLEAYVSGPQKVDNLASELRDFLQSILPAYMLPSKFVWLDRMPVSPGGKIDRAAVAQLTPSPKETVANADHAHEESLSPLLIQAFEHVLGHTIPAESNFFESGVSSLSILKIRALLKKQHGIDVPLLDFFEHPNIVALAGHLGQGQKPAPIKQAPVTHKGQKPANQRIAIIGMALRAPGCRDVTSFWQKTVHPQRCIEGPTRSIASDALDQPHFVDVTASMDGILQFDYPYFGIPQKEAKYMDPHQRLLLETAVHALENAGIQPRSTRRSMGAVFSSGPNTFYEKIVGTGFQREIDPFTLSVLNEKDFLSSRVAYHLNLTGPTYALQSACSSSLAAVHAACQHILLGECDLMIAGGVSADLDILGGYEYRPGRIFSNDGHCRVFSEDATGTIPGNGVGVVVLKSYEAALRDGDRIYATIEGIAQGNDGRERVSFVGPSVVGQAEVISRAYERAGISPAQVQYIEAHGTGTKIGDPIEVEALMRVFKGRSHAAAYCALSSLKSQFGHLGAAAGVAGLIRAALSLYHGTIPASLDVGKENSQIPFQGSPFYVNKTPKPWTQETRYAGVSSFGMGGTNVHAVLASANMGPQTSLEGELYFLPFSAHSQSALLRSLSGAEVYLGQTQARLEGLAMYQQRTKSKYAVRAGIFCSSRERAVTSLQTLIQVPSQIEGALIVESGLRVPSELLASAKTWLEGADLPATLQNANRSGIPWNIPNYPFDPLELPLPKVEARIHVKGQHPRVYEYRWHPSKILNERGDVDVSKTILCISPNKDEGEEFLETFSAVGARLALVTQGTFFEKQADMTWTIDFASQAQWESMFSALSEHSHIEVIYTADFDPGPFSGFEVPLKLIQAWNKIRPSQSLLLSVLTSNLAQIPSDAPCMPSRSLTLGLKNVVPAEYPRATVRVFDIPKPLRSHALIRVLAQTPQESCELALRGNILWALRPVEFESEHLWGQQADVLAWPRGTYVISGGNGGIGSYMAQMLARLNGVTVVSLSRTAKTTHDDGEIFWKREEGVFEARCDITDRARLKSIAAKIQNTFGPVVGVIHAAGVISGKPIHAMTPESFRGVFAPKIDGINNLEASFISEDLEIFLACSSLSSVCGVVGQADYSAANAYLNAWVMQRQAQGGPTKYVALLYPAWQGIGMANNADHKARHSGDAEFAISKEEGWRSTQLGLLFGYPNLLVSAADIDTTIAYFNDRARKQLSEDPHTQVDGATTLEIVEKAFKQVLGSETIDLETPFYDLGGDSLSQLDLYDLLSAQFPDQIELSNLTALKTVRAIATYLDRPKQGSTQDGPDPVIVLRRGNPSKKVVFVHPIGGEVFVYEDIVRHLNVDALMLGIRDPKAVEVKGYQLPISVEEMARMYANWLDPKEVQSIVGWSFGGLVAWEWIRQWEAHGVSGINLFMIDPPPLSKASRYVYTDSDLKKKIDAMPNVGRSLELMYKIMLENNVLLNSYDPKERVQGNASLFVAQEGDIAMAYASRAQWLENGCKDFFVNSLDIHELCANHDSIMKGASAEFISRRIEQSFRSR